MAHDPVNHPRHYTGHPSGIECIQVTEHMNFCLGNALKYIWRAGEKGDAIEDLQKARWYLDREIARLQAERATGSAGAVRAAGAQATAASSPAVAAPPPGLPRQNAPAAAKAAGGRGYRTAERLAVLQREWPAGQPVADIRATMNALPGPPVPNTTLVAQWARTRKLQRPGWFDRGAAISAGRRKTQPAPAGPGWADMLAWAETVDPDLVLRGNAGQRLAQINDLRQLEGKPLFLMPADAPLLPYADVPALAEAG